MKFYALAAGVVVAALSSGAQAETIERTFEVDASAFSFFPIEGPNTPAPADRVELNFTLIFDPSAAIGATTAGLTINSFTLSDPLAYAYDGSTYLTVATYPGIDGCGNPANSYCVFITDPAGADPTANGAYQITSSGGFWVSDTVTVTAGAIEVVPEPSTWALGLIGFGGIGWLASRRRSAAANA